MLCASPSSSPAIPPVSHLHYPRDHFMRLPEVISTRRQTCSLIYDLISSELLLSAFHSSVRTPPGGRQGEQQDSIMFPNDHVLTDC